jgi:hypothetical protein
MASKAHSPERPTPYFFILDDLELSDGVKSAFRGYSQHSIFKYTGIYLPNGKELTLESSNDHEKSIAIVGSYGEIIYHWKD